jgi:hypothetical protein
VRADAALEVQRALESVESDSARLRAEAEAEAQQLRESAYEESERLRREARDEAEQLRQSARSDTDALRTDAEQLRDSVQQEADRLLTASSEEAQRLRDAAERDAERIRSDAENQARVDREAADEAIREVLDKAGTDAEQIREQAREQGQAEAAQLVEAQVQEAVAAARTELDAEKVRVYGLLGSANDSVAEVRSSMRELIEALGHSMGSVNGATGSIDALMTRLRDAALDSGVVIDGPPVDDVVPEPRDGDTGPIEAVDDEAGAAGDSHESAFDHDTIYRDSTGNSHDPDETDAEVGESGNDEGRRPLGLLFGASHKSRASKR